MSKKRKVKTLIPEKEIKIGGFSTSLEDRDDALEEYGSHLGSFDNLFEEEDDDDDDEY
jgi:hypothetical protein